MRTSNLDIRELVFDRMTLLFGRPEAHTAQALAEEYARVLRRFPRDTLRRAVDHLAETHKYRRWPSVAEVVAACLKASPERQTVPSARPADRRQLVADTLRSKPGQEALKSGYGHSVRLFVEDHGRAPNGAQYQQMAVANKRAQRLAETELAAGSGASASHVAGDGCARGSAQARVSGVKRPDSQLASRIGHQVARPIDAEAEKRRGWRKLGILVIAIDDARLTWPEQQLIEALDNRLYGARKQPKQRKQPKR